MRILKIELTNRCNANCIYCHKPEILGDMEWDMFTAIVDEFPEVKEVQPQWFGEATLHPRFYDALEYLKQRNKRIVFYTNGSLIIPERLAEIAPSRVIFSIEADNKELYEKLRRGLNWETVLNNIETFQKIKCTTTKTSVNMVVTNEVEPRKKQIMEFWKDRVDLVCVSREQPLNREVKGHYNQTRGCKRIYETMAIRYNGDVAPCCGRLAQDIVLGNVKYGARKVWEGEKFNGFRERVKRGEEEICKRCGFNWVKE